MESVAIHSKKIFILTFVSMFLLVVLLEIIFGLFSYHMIAKSIKEQLQTRCLGISTSVAAFLESDPEGYKEFSKSLNTDSDYYIATNETLNKIFYGWENRIIYLGSSIFVPKSDRMILFGMVKDSKNPLYGPPGTIIELSEEGIQAYKSQTTYVSTHPIKSQFGSYLSAFVPIKDKDNTVIGMVTTRISGEQYTETINGIIIFIFCSLIAVTIIFGIALLLYFGFFEKLFAIDSLTGLYNRTFFLRTVRKHHKNLKKHKEHSFVFMLDLDHFKKVNDTYGHPFGDIVLQSVSKIVKNILRESDCVARYGGEEFIGLLTNLTPQSADVVMNRIVNTVAAKKIYNRENNMGIYITLSIGYAMLNEKESPLETIEKADIALYHAKKTRNTVSFFNDDMQKMK